MRVNAEHCLSNWLVNMLRN